MDVPQISMWTVQSDLFYRMRQESSIKNLHVKFRQVRVEGFQDHPFLLTDRPCSIFLVLRKTRSKVDVLVQKEINLANEIYRLYFS